MGRIADRALKVLRGSRSRKIRKVTVADKVHDRRTTDTLMNSVLAPIEVDDPLEKGAKIVVMRSLRDDSLAWLHSHKHIDEAQYRAGREMQTLYERSEIGNVQSNDFSKEPVDGGGIREPLAETTQRAIAKVAAIEKALGMEGAALARDVLCYGRTIRECAVIRFGGEPPHSFMKYTGQRVREVLESCAIELGLASRS